MSDVGKRVIELREEKGWSQYKLYKIAQIGQTTLSDIESSKKVPTVTTLAKICKALEISLSDFFAEDDNIAEKQNNNDTDILPDHVQKELDLAREFILYKYGIKKAPADK